METFEQELRESYKEYGTATGIPRKHDEPDANELEEEMRSDIPLCPDCKVIMKLRKNRLDQRHFWGCNRYPLCKGTLPIVTDGKPTAVIQREMMIAKRTGVDADEMDVSSRMGSVKRPTSTSAASVDGHGSSHGNSSGNGSFEKVERGKPNLEKPELTEEELEMIMTLRRKGKGKSL